MKPYAEKVITKAKKGSLHDRRQVLKMIQDKSVVAKLLKKLVPSMKTVMVVIQELQEQDIDRVMEQN